MLKKQNQDVTWKPYLFLPSITAGLMFDIKKILTSHTECRDPLGKYIARCQLWGQWYPVLWYFCRLVVHFWWTHSSGPNDLFLWTNLKWKELFSTVIGLSLTFSYYCTTIYQPHNCSHRQDLSLRMDTPILTQ